MVKQKKCRVCEGELVNILDLRKIPLVNDFSKTEKYPLKLAVCSECSLLQLSTIIPPEKIFKRYDYLTSASLSLTLDLKSLVEFCVEEFRLNKKSRILDIGCNDGSFLETFKKTGREILGVEPAKNVSKIAVNKGIKVVNDFFSLKLAKKIKQKNGQFDLITSLHNFANILEINDFLEGIKFLLSENGVLVIEVADADKMIKESRFDSIYHEHYSYFSLPVLKKILSFNGFKVFRSERNLKQGGAIRVFAKKGPAKKFSPINLDLDKYRKYAGRVEKHISELRRIFKDYKKVVGFGAPAKAVVIANLLKLDKQNIEFIVDSTKFKQGKLLPGTDIPIYAEEKLGEVESETVFIFAWNYEDEVLEKLKSFGVRKAIIPFPNLKIIDLAC